MRIASGVILLIAGIWSLIAGSCSAATGGATTAFSGWLSDGQKKVKPATQPQQRQDDYDAMLKLGGEIAGLDDKELAQVEAGKRAASRLFITGIVIASAGLLCIIAAVFLLLDRGRIFSIIAPVIGIVGEGLWLVMISFGSSTMMLAAIKIGLYGVGIVGATRIGRARLPPAT